MNYDPYLASQTPRALAEPVVFGDSSPQPWSASEVVSTAWEQFKANWVVLVGSSVVATAIAGVIGQIPSVVLLTGAVSGTRSRLLMSAASILLSQVVGLFFHVGLTRMMLATARGQKPEWSTLFSGGDRFVAAFGAAALQLLGVMSGLILLVVPGIIFGLGLFATQFYVIDASLGPVEAIKASWAATRGQRGEIFVLNLIGMGLSVLGLLMCCLGIGFTAPIFSLASAVAFTRLSGRGATPSQSLTGYGGYPAY